MKIVEGMPFVDYFEAPGISSSRLKRAGKTAAHYFAPAKEPTEAMQVGTAFHAHFLENRIEYCSRPAGINRRTTAGKAEYAEWADKHSGLIELPAERCADISGAMNALRNNDDVMGIFSGGSAEVSFLDETGKCRADYYNADESYIADLKTTSDASPDGFMRQSTNLEYWIQAAWYMRKTKVSRFIFVAIEMNFPYAHGIYEYSAVDIENANAVIDMRLERIAEFEAMRSQGEVASSSYGYHGLTLPAWALTK